MNYEDAYELLRKYGQEHVLAYYDELTDAEKKRTVRADCGN